MTLEKYVAFATQSFTLPGVCIKIRDVLDDRRSGAEDIARLIAVDPSLTAKILRLANSALFRFPSQIESIAKAINVIGGEALYNLVVAETANTAFQHFGSDLIRLDRHWQESVYCGMVGKHLAKQSGIRGSERFFVMGILQNLSELVVAKRTPERYKAYTNSDDSLLPWERQEQHFGFSFAACSGTIMEQWRLPMPLYFAVKNLHNLQKQATDADIALLACAQRVTIRENRRETFANIELLPAQMTNVLTVGDETLDTAVSFANKETEKVSSLLN
ncbi:HDOD domain-containing protein [Alteromonas pelagimontana]|uniref:HDOD domain-containing protein n=1 Tax=Alteromonas pelagimontana TaxID=1858656 RepID=A0A6M4MCY6_9ALTE|nr:HDOD domain-containing protein [Alteromonas pelagimontana]QJR79996.1 HDOD domain-containing protein [Alteromonas pelagimontana]